MKTLTAGNRITIPPTLLVSVVGQEFGGLEVHVLTLYKELCARGRNPLILVIANSPLHQRIQQAGLVSYAIPFYNFRGYYRVLSFVLTGVLAWLCKRHDIEIVHCNHRFELRSALRVARIFGLKVILNYHVAVQFDTAILRGIDAFITTALNIVRYVDEKNRNDDLGIKQTQMIPPMFDAEKFLKFHSTVPHETWFGDTFGISIKPCAVISSIGNMVSDLQAKNYPLLFKAMAILIHEKRTPVQAVLVGDGPVRPYLENLVRTLDIEDYVHFLGCTFEHTPGVLYHSDIFVLASSREAFGIVFLEAGLMRKPAIGARNTGAEAIILHEKTGLLFQNDSADSLAAAIQILVNDPVRAHQFGAQAYDHIMKYFSPSMVVEQYESLYASLSRAR